MNKCSYVCLYYSTYFLYVKWFLLKKYLYFNGVLQDGCGFKVEPEKKFEDYYKKHLK